MLCSIGDFWIWLNGIVDIEELEDFKPLCEECTSSPVFQLWLLANTEL